MYQTLLTSLENNIFTITINRSDKLNAINKQVMTDISAVMDEVNADDEIRSVIFTGAGTKAFVAGADISEFTSMNSHEGMALAKFGQDTFFKIENCKKPVIAAVNGFALGGGCELAMACHMRIASDNAKFGQPEINLGLIPGYGGTQRLPKLIGKGRTLELILTGNMIDAQTAFNFGLVNHVVPQKDLLTTATQLLAEINSKGSLSVSTAINAVNHADSGMKGYEAEIFGFGECFVSEDMKEGAQAFLEKRKPVFNNK